MTMKLSLLTREYPPAIYGGAGVHVAQLVPQLRKLIDVEVHCMGDPRDGAQAHAEDFPPGANAALRVLGADLGMAASIGADVDIIHSHTWYANMAGHLGSLMQDIPHVVTSHSLEPHRPWKAEQLGGGYRVSSWAEKTAYEAADAVLGAAGYHWYEVSNWARDPAVHACRHNLAYWRGQDWWGIGPGAHSHVGGLRWWNTKHPRAYAQLLAAGRTPSVGRELLDAATREEERVLLGVRLAEGLPLGAAQLGSPRVRSALADLVADGLIEAGPLGDVVDAGGGPGAGGTAAGGTGPAPAVAPRVVLTLRGRLLADAVVRALA